MKAINNYVIFTPIEEKSKKSFIILEEKPKETKGKVLSVGSKCSTIKKGDTILVPRYADQYVIDNVCYSIVKEEDISAVFK